MRKLLILLLIMLLSLSCLASKKDSVEVILPILEVNSNNGDLLIILSAISMYKKQTCVDSNNLLNFFLLRDNEKYIKLFNGKRMVQINDFSNSSILKNCLGVVNVKGCCFFIYNGSGLGLDEFGKVFLKTSENKSFYISNNTENEGEFYEEDDRIDCIDCKIFYKDGRFFFKFDEPSCYGNNGGLMLW